MSDVFLTDLAFGSDFEVSPTSGIDSMSGIRNLKEALFRRLITTKGSMLHLPDYGVGIKGYLNGPNTLSAQQRLAGDIRDNFLRDPRVVRVISVKVQKDDLNPGRATFFIKIEAKGYGEIDLSYGVEG